MVTMSASSVKMGSGCSLARLVSLTPSGASRVGPRYPLADSLLEFFSIPTCHSLSVFSGGFSSSFVLRSALGGFCAQRLGVRGVACLFVWLLASESDGRPPPHPAGTSRISPKTWKFPASESSNHRPVYCSASHNSEVMKNSSSQLMAEWIRRLGRGRVGTMGCNSAVKQGGETMSVKAPQTRQRHRLEEERNETTFHCNEDRN